MSTSPNSSRKKNNKGCGCSLPMLLLTIGASYGWFIYLGNPLPKTNDVAELWQAGQSWVATMLGRDTSNSDIKDNIPVTEIERAEAPLPVTTDQEKKGDRPTPQLKASPSPSKATSQPVALKPNSPWEQKSIRGIYLSRYQITNNASEAKVRGRVRYYKSQGFNTILHGVWGNGCTMYRSQVMQKMLGMTSCPNLFREQWLHWLIDEAHKQNMEVHAYFEKGIKLDKNSPIFDRAVRQKWLVPGVDRTYAYIDHYVLDVQVPEVRQLFKAIATEFVQKYPRIDAVQWDDYVGYHSELATTGNKTEQLTTFMKDMIKSVKTANPQVSFDLCHHNPYWAKRYFAADWENWGIDRAFIQVYNDGNFEKELGYVRQYDGAAITNNQLHRLKPLIADQGVKGILVFPHSGKPEETALQVHNTVNP